MKNLTVDEKLAALKKTARRVTKEEALHRGLDALEATGLPLEGVASLARSVGLDLEDIANSFGSSHSIPHRVPPVEIEADVVRKLQDAVSRIEARIQTTGNVAIPAIPPQSNDYLIVKNGLVIDRSQFTVAFREQQCIIGNRILFDLAERLGRAPGRWFSFGELRDDVWKDSQALDTTIGRALRLLRDQLKKAGVTGITIENPRNMKKHARLLIR